VVGSCLSKGILSSFFHHHHQSHAIMAEITYATIHAACQKDAKYKELMERLRGYASEQSEQKQKQRAAFRKILQLDKLEDLAMERMGNCEGDSENEALEHCTGNDQENWFWFWSGAEDLCFDGMVQAAIDASNAQSMIEVIQDKMKVNRALMTSREEEIKAKLEEEAKEA